MNAVPPSPFTSLVRALVAAAACGSLSVALGDVAARLAADLDRTAVGSRGLEGGVALVSVAVGGIALGVVTVGCLLTAVAAAARLGGRTVTRLESTASRLTPTLLRRAIAVGVGTGLLASVAGAATAVEPEGPGTSTAAQQDADGTGTQQAGGPAPTGLDLGWQVTSVTGPHDEADAAGQAGEAGQAGQAGEAGQAGRAPTAPVVTTDALLAATSPTALPPVDDGVPALVSGVGPEAARPTGGASAGPSTITVTVTVNPGDSLWAIAAAHLPAGSGDAEIAATWPRWYEANRAVVGDDPDVIHPGQVLTAPVEEQP